MDYMTNVFYLEPSDFQSIKKIKPHVSKNRPSLVMLQSIGCGHCKTTKPIINDMASKVNFNVYTIPSDDTNFGMRDFLKQAVNQGELNISGVPMFIVYNSAGNLVPSKILMGRQEPSQLTSLMSDVK